MTDTSEGHGTYGGTTRDDGSDQEDPTPPEGAEEWTEKVEKGADGSS